MKRQSILDNSEVRFDKKTGIPRKIRGEFALPISDTDEVSIKSFLVDNSSDLKLDANEDDLLLIKDVSTSTGRAVRFRQAKDGLPIFGTEILVRLDNNKRIKQLDLNHVPAALDTSLADDEKELTVAQVTKAANEAIGKHKKRQKADKPEKGYFPIASGLRLAYMLILPTKEPLHDWKIIIDAHTGEVLQKNDLIMYMPDGQGLVFNPNPVVTAEDNTFRDPTATVATCGFAGTDLATIDAEAVTRTLKDITLSGGVHKLEGPYVKMRNFGSPDIAPPEEANANDFNYSSSDDAFEAVMIYYHVDTIQRYIQSLGITTAHSGQIEADAHDMLSGTWGEYHGAWFSPSDGGIHFGNSGDCKPDRGEDADAMIHEYGHAIQNDQVPGWGNTNPTTLRDETGAMGEGFGDILACVYFAPNHAFQREVFEDWCFADEGGMRSVNGTKTYPWNIASGAGGDWQNNVHRDGGIWSSALWNIYLALGGDSVTLADREAARDEVLRTVINSHDRLTSTATMPEGAEAFMDENAELKEHRLQNGIDILNSFHDRDLLHCETGSDLKIDALWSQQDDSSVRSWEQVEAGQDNWFYATVRNASTTTAARAFVLTFSFKSPFATPIYPGDFRDNIISAAVDFELAPGASKTVKARWSREMIPAIPSGATQRHGCIMAEVYNPEDHVATGVTSIGASNGKLKQRNTDIVDLLPDETADFFVDISNYHILKPELARLEIIREPRWQHVEISLHHPNKKFLKKFMGRVEYVKPTAVVGAMEPVAGLPELRVLERTRVEIAMGALRRPLIMDLAAGSSMPLPESAEADNATLDDAFLAPADPAFMRMDADWVPEKKGARLAIRSGLRVGLPVLMKPRDRTLLNFKIKTPKDARPGDHFTVKVTQRNKRGSLLGEFDIQVNVVAKK